MEKITILPDGTIPPVEMTSLGFEDALSPYRETPADIACVLKGGAFITEKTVFERVVTGITENGVIGYKYFDFGEDYSSKTMEFAARVTGCGCESTLHIHIDSEDGEEIGSCPVGSGDGIAHAIVKKVTGRHALFFTVSAGYHSSENKDDPNDWIAGMFRGRVLFELKSFMFMK